MMLAPPWSGAPSAHLPRHHHAVAHALCLAALSKRSPFRFGRRRRTFRPTTKTFAARGVYGTSAITAITVQNTLGVSGVLELPTEIIAAQIDAVLSDIGADAVKTGMLSSVPIIQTVAAKLRARKIEKLVVDPVMVAKSGDRLLREDAVQAVRERMLPLALVLTPNLYEAEILLGRSVRTVDEMKEAARVIATMGAHHVVVKGGRRGDQVVDVLFDGIECIEYSMTLIIHAQHTGNGCTFSAAIAAELAKGARGALERSDSQNLSHIRPCSKRTSLVTVMRTAAAFPVCNFLLARAVFCLRHRKLHILVTKPRRLAHAKLYTGANPQLTLEVSMLRKTLIAACPSSVSHHLFFSHSRSGPTSSKCRAEPISAPAF
jgi:hydroxymethylpyrimidine/phosphomethylpyrimidine kinase